MPPKAIWQKALGKTTCHSSHRPTQLERSIGPSQKSLVFRDAWPPLSGASTRFRPSFIKGMTFRGTPTRVIKGSYDETTARRSRLDFSGPAIQTHGRVVRVSPSSETNRAWKRRQRNVSADPGACARVLCRVGRGPAYRRPGSCFSPGSAAAAARSPGGAICSPRRTAGSHYFGRAQVRGVPCCARRRPARYRRRGPAMAARSRRRPPIRDRRWIPWAAGARRWVWAGRLLAGDIASRRCRRRGLARRIALRGANAPPIVADLRQAGNSAGDEYR